MELPHRSFNSRLAFRKKQRMNHISCLSTISAFNVCWVVPHFRGAKEIVQVLLGLFQLVAGRHGLSVPPPAR